jgi:hypothetical protein
MIAAPLLAAFIGMSLSAQAEEFRHPPGDPHRPIRHDH